MVSVISYSVVPASLSSLVQCVGTNTLGYLLKAKITAVISFMIQAPESLFTRIGSGLFHKHNIRLEKPVNNKHSGLLSPFISYEEN
jgi:hypothetical protein